MLLLRRFLVFVHWPSAVELEEAEAKVGAEGLATTRYGDERLLPLLLGEGEDGLRSTSILGSKGTQAASPPLCCLADYAAAYTTAAAFAARRGHSRSHRCCCCCCFSATCLCPRWAPGDALLHGPLLLAQTVVMVAMPVFDSPQVRRCRLGHEKK